MERWRIIPGWPEYEASDDGRVRRAIKSSNRPAGLILKPDVRKHGHLAVQLHRDGERTLAYVHRLVCHTFNGDPPSPKHRVLHSDGNPANNQSGNLRWGTQTDNLEDARRHGTMAIGERARHAKLSESGARSVAGMKARGLLQREIAAELGISQGQVSRIIRRERWKHL